MQNVPARSARFFALRPKYSLCGALAVAALGAFALVGSGCKSNLPPTAMAEAAGAGERPVAMKGETNYFEQKIAATVTISRGFNRNFGGEKNHEGGGRGRGRGRYHSGDDATNVGLSDSYPTSNGGESESEQKELYEDMVRIAKAQRAAGSPMPPVTIRLKLENRGAEAVEVDLLEVNSDLGNFAVRPTKLTLAPGQTGETEPMVSQLGVTSDEIPMKVVLRTAGKKESQVIPVKSVFTALEKK